MSLISQCFLFFLLLLWAEDKNPSPTTPRKQHAGIRLNRSKFACSGGFPSSEVFLRKRLSNYIPLPNPPTAPAGPNPITSCVQLPQAAESCDGIYTTSLSRENQVCEPYVYMGGTSTKPATPAGTTSVRCAKRPIRITAWIFRSKLSWSGSLWHLTHRGNLIRRNFIEIARSREFGFGDAKRAQALNWRFSRAEEPGRVRVGQDHVRITLQSVEIVTRKAFADFRGGQQQARLFDQGVRVFIGQWRLGFERFIHRNDELR